jgi:hypothetical protein
MVKGKEGVTTLGDRVMSRRWEGHGSTAVGVGKGQFECLADVWKKKPRCERHAPPSGTSTANHSTPRSSITASTIFSLGTASCSGTHRVQCVVYPQDYRSAQKQTCEVNETPDCLH